MTNFRFGNSVVTRLVISSTTTSPPAIIGPLMIGCMKLDSPLATKLRPLAPPCSDSTIAVSSAARHTGSQDGL